MRLILFKILLFTYSLPALAQSLSQEEHCLALEEKLNIQSQLYDAHINVYLNHLEKCQPPIEHQFSLYKKLLDQLLKKENFSPLILESIHRVIQYMLNSIPDPNVEPLQTLAHKSWDTLPEQMEDVTFHISPAVNYHLERPLSVSKNVQKIRGVPFHVTVISQKFVSQFSICKNTKEFQHLLNPLHSFWQDTVFAFLQSVNSNQLHSLQQLYTLYHSIHSTSFDVPTYSPFISWIHLPLPFINFLSDSIDWSTSFFQNNYDWLNSLLSLLKIHINVSDKMQTYCVPYQPFINKEFTEYHYTVKFTEAHRFSTEKRGEILQWIQEHLKQQNPMFFFRSHILPEKDHIYMYFITNHSRQE